MAVIELVINPVAGKGRALRIGEEAAALLKSHGIDFAKHLTDHPRHATELAREAAGRGAETVIAFGGDGTLTETAAGLRHTRTALGVVPAGTGNDFIKTIGTPREWREALEFILTHPARPVNSGMMNDRFFLNVGGAGFDVMVLDFANAARKRLSGIGSYLYGVLRAISSFRPIPMHVEIGGDVVLDGHYMICSVGNGRFIGGGIPITPKADVTDGLFDHSAGGCRAPLENSLLSALADDGNALQASPGAQLSGKQLHLVLARNAAAAGWRDPARGAHALCV